MIIVLCYTTIMEQLKECLDCKEGKPLSEFWARPARPRGQSYCKSCHMTRVKEWQRGNRAKVTDLQRTYRWKSYGLTDEEVLIAQSIEGCEVCGSVKRLSVDHCHRQNRYRGVLCGLCNSALGSVDDSIEILEKLINYLKERN